MKKLLNKLIAHPVLVKELGLEISKEIIYTVLFVMLMFINVPMHVNDYMTDSEIINYLLGFASFIFDFFIWIVFLFPFAKMRVHISTQSHKKKSWLYFLLILLYVLVHLTLVYLRLNYLNPLVFFEKLIVLETIWGSFMMPFVVLVCYRIIRFLLY